MTTPNKPDPRLVFTVPQLPFRDEDSTDPGLQVTDLREDPAHVFTSSITELLDDAGAEFAWPTLEGIRETVTRTQRVTEGQRQAVANIRKAVTAKEARGGRFGGWGRRYDK